MDGDRQGLVVQPPQRLEQQFGLRAGVDEDDGHAGGADALEDRGGARQAHVAGPGQAALGQDHGDLRRGASGDLDSRRAADDVGHRRRWWATVADRPMRRTAGARAARRARQRANWSPRLMPARAWTSSMTMRRGRRRTPGRGLGEQQGQAFGRGEEEVGRVLRCRLRRSAGVSPVRVSTVTGERISSTGRLRLRAMSVGQRLQRADV